MGAASPKVLAVDHGDWSCGRVKSLEQPCIDAEPAGLAVPASIVLEIRTVRKRRAAAASAEMVRYELRIPFVSREVFPWRDKVELLRRVVGVERTALGAERASAAR